MAVQLFVLKNVPEDEVEQVRSLLTDHAINFYETPERIRGLSVPAIWLPDAAELPKARALLDAYASERATTAQENYQALKQRGEARGFADIIREHPLRFIAYCGAIVAVLYFSITPFLRLLQL